MSSKFSAAATDRSLSGATDEFVWAEAGHDEAHGFVMPPLLALLSAAGATSVLDLGCGNGSLTAALAKRGFSMTGTDASASGIGIARAAYPGVRFEQMDLAEPLHEEHRSRYDAVIAIEVIEHLLLPRTLLRNAKDALKPGGLLVLSTPYHGYLKNLALALAGKFDEHWHPLRDFGHVKFFSRRTIMALLSEFGFEQTTFTRVGRIPALARSMVVSGRKPR